MKYSIKYSSKFKTHFKKLGSSLQREARGVIELLANGEALEQKYRDHALKGPLKGLRECHIKPDLLLIYEKQDDGVLILYCFDIGSHSELF